MITEKAIAIGTGCSAEDAKKWLNPVIAACAHYGITSNRAIAAFLANIGVETGGLTKLVENLNYSAQGLANTWPNRYRETLKDGTKRPNALAEKLARNPEAIANNVYANRMGNGDEASGDGWKYRGHGPMQLTGKDNYLAYEKASGYMVMNQPEILAIDPLLAIDSAAWFFAERGKCIPAANAGNFDEVVRRINGSLPNDANKGPLRRKRYQDCLAQL
ncbi:endolysin [Pantoea phage Kyle]|uniref:Endolysin n=1 Tax=Pantoea phage Kyle TaxID=2589665 RepID=A0A514A8T2_9CAUD|nr:endolysin [Pantoea phage Kyle]QDH49676.1 endolysin [Pantoea phage Kyle]